MNLTRLSFSGIGPFQGPAVRIDFAALGEGLIALVGPNGAGKTTALDCVGLALYGHMPSRPGTLYDFCRGRAAFAEVAFRDGATDIVARLQVDTHAKKAERYLFVDGRPVTTGRMQEFQREIAERFGSERIFLSSVFMAQNTVGGPSTGAFLQLPKAERKEMFIELLGLAHLQVLAERARGARTSAGIRLEAARVAFEKATTDLSTLAQLEQNLPTIVAGVDVAREALEVASAAETEAERAVERAKGAAERIRLLEAAEAAAVKAWGAAGEDEGYRTHQIENARELQNDASTTELRARAQHQRALQALEVRESSLRKLIARKDDVAVAKVRVPELEAAETAEAQAQQAELDARSRLASAQNRRTDLAGTVRALEKAHNSAIDRLKATAALMRKAPCATAEVWTGANAPQGVPHTINADLAGTCPLLEHARGAWESLESPAPDPHLDAARAALAEAVKQLDFVEVAHTRADWLPVQSLAQIRNDLAAARTTAGLAGAVEHAEEDLGRLDHDRQAATQALQEALHGASEVGKRAAGERAVAEQAFVEAKAKTGAALKAHEDALAALLVAKGESELPEAERRRIEAKAARGVLEETVSRAVNSLTIIRAETERLRAEKEVNQGRVEEAAEAGAQLSDWTLLEKALGRDGVQALEIDAAGPEVSRLANDLLATCYGPRFSMSLETQREKKSGEGSSEVFEVRVYDGKDHRTAEALSGGEQVIVAEALGLAISIYNARKSGVRWGVIFRDEPTAALDPENAVRYIEMVRRAKALGGFDQVVVITHREEVAQRCDARLIVEGGRIVPEGAPLRAMTPA